ncbi:MULTISPECIES: class I SAM-dependent methyltransferase [Streptomyces]|uniref:Trans-aconitate 2-methyltransferase n=1 Tax=Streptomyces chartreusis NRRL 3882 TaxID=1079985 RepID=A0A2N9B522_STRCX|nr:MULTISPECIES: class I SAM-dependent methyltransferase [Streptomyces]MYS90569.1 methyltransferase domain-containing protein [Streptomyces sp. SID5464]SOR78445.1 Trans-aconitate 2-methyltransferase [Streptomyces chartreusis NRRL 3882]
MGLSLATAERWVERWELQQQRYAVDREERFTVIADVVEHVTAGHDSRPLVVDLGCGPGSLAARLVRRLPDAEIVAVDRDPLLLELGRTHHPDAARYIDAEIGAPGWTWTLDLDRPLDAAVSTTALHYLDRDTLLRTYRQLAALLRPGGVLVNGDHLPQDDTGPGGIAAHVGRCRADRQRVFAHEDWGSWWAAVSEDPELTDLLAERRRRAAPLDTGRPAELPLSAHLELLRQAGFATAGPVWQYGDSCVVVAVR